MKKHLGIVLFYLILSFLFFDLFVKERSNIDFYIISSLFIMFVGWVLNLSPQLRIKFLFWTLIFNCGLVFYVQQEMLNYKRHTYRYSYRYEIGHGYQNNISVRNYSINRKRAIEEEEKKAKERAKMRSYSGSSGSSYYGGSSHYGGGLSGGK